MVFKTTTMLHFRCGGAACSNDDSMIYFDNSSPSITSMCSKFRHHMELAGDGDVSAVR